MTFIPAHSNDEALTVDPGSVVWNGGDKRNVRVPFTMPKAQVYYWRAVWQSDEQETLEGLEAGDYVDFDGDDPEDAARWLRESDEDK